MRATGIIISTLLMVLGFLLIVGLGVAAAETLYRYHRADGVEVTTNDFDNIPEKYRNSVERIIAPEESKIASDSEEKY